MIEYPLVSVIIIFLDMDKYIKEAIESVLAQTYSHWELLLIDDGSTDNSSEIALQYAAQYPEKIRYLEHSNHQNRGMSTSRNLGIQNAEGEYVAFLDADDYWLPERLEVHVRALDSFPKVGMLYGSTKYWFSWMDRPEDRERDFIPKLRVRRTTLFDPPELIPLLLEGKVEVPCTCSILVRRELAKKIGGFEESFRGMYEDQVFYAKICLSTSVLATGDCLAWYRQHPESNYSIAVNAGNVHSLHVHFLNWLKQYCNDQEVKDEGLLRTIHRQLWLYDSPSHRLLPRFFLNGLRRLKKWILRAEEQFLPEVFRRRLWRNR
jgi:glycosyltransferase involved in cell wall biosynthesis